jgi:hypothetical protein
MSASLTPIPIGVQRGDILTPAQWRSYTEAVAALVRPAPDGNDGTRILGRSLGLPVPFSPRDPLFRTRGVGPGEALTVGDGQWLYILYMGSTFNNNTNPSVTFFTTTGFSTATLFTAAGAASARQVLILGTGQTFRGCSTLNDDRAANNGGAIGIFQSVPYDLEVIATLATQSAPFSVPSGKVAMITAVLNATNASSFQFAIDGGWGPQLRTAQTAADAVYQSGTMPPALLLRAGQTLAPVTGINLYISGVLANAA